jgi:hypothetical protein
MLCTYTRSMRRSCLNQDRHTSYNHEETLNYYRHASLGIHGGSNYDLKPATTPPCWTDHWWSPHRLRSSRGSYNTIALRFGRCFEGTDAAFPGENVCSFVAGKEHDLWTIFYHDPYHGSHNLWLARRTERQAREAPKEVA